MMKSNQKSLMQISRLNESIKLIITIKELSLSENLGDKNDRTFSEQFFCFVPLAVLEGKLQYFKQYKYAS